MLAALVLFLRLLALPQSVIDWDESMYLLVARRFDLHYFLQVPPPLSLLAELERIMALRPRYVVEEYRRDPTFLTHLQAHLARDYALERSIQGVLLYRPVS